MANIEASQPDVSLYDVAEHIVGYRPEDIPEEEWDGPVFDKPTIEAWDQALKELIAAVRDGRLKVRGRPPGSNRSEELRPDDFDDIKVCSPFADFDFGIEFSGKGVLEFDEDGRAKIVKRASDFGGRSEAIWTHLVAVSGAEVLRLWPSQPATSKSLNTRKREATIRATEYILASGTEFETEKERENTIMKRVADDIGETITDRYVRSIKACTRNKRRS